MWMGKERRGEGRMSPCLTLLSAPRPVQQEDSQAQLQLHASHEVHHILPQQEDPEMQEGRADTRMQLQRRCGDMPIGGYVQDAVSGLQS